MVKAEIVVNGLIMESAWGRIINDQLCPASSSNSVGVAISWPRVKGRSTSTLGKPPPYLATLKELRLAEGVIPNLIIPPNPFLTIILLWVTPTANRNTYSVATLVGQLPRVACVARNPGL